MILLVSIIDVLALLRASWRLLRNRSSIRLRWPLLARRKPDSWDALRGTLPGAAVGALAFPVIPILSVEAWALLCKPPHFVGIGPLAFQTASFVLLALYVFLASALVWCCAIALSVQLWSYLCWRGILGPWVATVFGAVLAALTASFFLRFDLASDGRISAVLLMGAAGGASGATVWWAAYRPEILLSRLRLCPLMTRRTCMGHLG